MRQRLLEARRRESGFTLIELLIVIVILGVLAAVVVLAVGAFNDRGEAAACKADVKAVEVAVEAYRAKNGTYPTSLDVLVNDPNENYLRNLPNQTPDSGEYWIEYDASNGAVTGYVNNEGTDNDDMCAGGSFDGTASPGEPGGGEEAPGAVTGLSVTSTNQTSVTITWSAPASGSVTNYTIQWSTNSNFNNPSTATRNAAPFTINSLSAGTTYHVRVAANSDAGIGPWAQIQVTTWSTPSAPANVNVQSNCPSVQGQGRVCTASWNASSGNPAPTYQWQRDNRNGTCDASDFNGGNGFAEGTATTTSITLTNLTNDQNYCFRVRAVNDAGESSWVYKDFRP